MSAELCGGYRDADLQRSGFPWGGGGSISLRGGGGGGEPMVLKSKPHLGQSIRPTRTRSPQRGQGRDEVRRRTARTTNQIRTTKRTKRMKNSIGPMFMVEPYSLVAGGDGPDLGG